MIIKSFNRYHIFGDTDEITLSPKASSSVNGFFCSSCLVESHFHCFYIVFLVTFLLALDTSICKIKCLTNSAASKYYSSASHHEQKNKTTGRSI